MSSYRPLDVNSLEYNNNNNSKSGLTISFGSINRLMYTHYMIIPSNFLSFLSLVDYANTMNANPFEDAPPTYASSVPMDAPPQQPQAVRMQVPVQAAAPIPPPAAPVPGEKHSIFSKRYYQAFFDVSTEVVLTRIRRALIPFGPLFFDNGNTVSLPAVSLDNVARMEEGTEVPEPTIANTNPFATSSAAPVGVITPTAQPASPAKRSLDSYAPDIYGPFWIATTLIFVLGVVGNLVDYLQYKGATTWHYDFEKVTVAATLFYVLITIAPAIVWYIVRKFNVPYTLSAMICLYGYSLSIYIPITILCAIPVPYLNLAAICLAALVSTFFLCRNIFAKFLAATPANVDVNGTVNGTPSTEVLADAELDPATEHKKAGLVIVTGVSVVHFGVAIACYFYFLSF